MESKPLCRLCIEEVEPLIDIFGEFGRYQQMQGIVLQHFNIEVKEDDLLSDKMCTDCWGKLVDFHAFFNQVQKAQERITMVVIEDDKLDEDDFYGYMSHKIMVPDENTLKEVSFNYKLDTDEYKIHANSTTDNEHVESSQFDGNQSEDTMKHEYLVQIDTNDRVPDPDNEAKIEESSLQSDFDASCDEYVSFHQGSEPQNDEILMETSPKPKSNYTKRKSRNKTCYKSSPEFECKKQQTTNLFPAQSHFIDTSEEASAKRKRNRQVRPERKPDSKSSNEEQKLKEIDLIESYYKMQCNLCHEELEKFQSLFDHYREVHQFRGFIICCGKKFFRRRAIVEHVLWHTYPEKFTCTECESIMPNKRSFDNHMLLHASPDEKLYECEECSKRFSKKFKFEKHKLSHLKDYEKQYLCDECDKPYATEALLRAHKRVVHQQSYSNICEICARVFKSRVFFEKHQLEHQGQNLPKVQCQICDTWMKNEHTMRAHMRNHQDEGREHECDICGKKGPSRNAITKHKRFVHLSERKFKCTLCEKAFKRAITLKEHMTVHTGEILYTCTFCPKTFNSGANMHAHRKKAHPTEWFEDKQHKLESLKPMDITEQIRFD